MLCFFSTALHSLQQQQQQQQPLQQQHAKGVGKRKIFKKKLFIVSFY
jgi:hypothetical protein